MPRLVLVSAGVLVNDAGCVLIAERPPGKSMAGLWEFPGGKVEPEESPEAALARELKEELDIAVSAERLEPFAFASHAYDAFHLLMPVFVCRAWSGDIRPREGQKVAWARPEDLAGYPMPPADAPLLGELKTRL
ncbi:MAG: (deoxy)nucleoside triphosphate pyrophosphohydrolase [Pseudomonadota bacterium]